MSDAWSGKVGGDLAGRYAVCERVVRQGSFGADVALTREAGIVALGVDAEAVDLVGVDEAIRILDGAGVRVSSYMALDDILRDDGAPSPLGEVARRLDVAASLAAPVAVAVTGPLGHQRVGEAEQTCRDWLERAATMAVDRGMLIALEPTHPLMRRWSFVHTFEHALALVDGIAGAAVVVDLGHLWWQRDLEQLIRAHVDAIATVQVTNVEATALAGLRYERAPLDVGDVPVASIVAALESAGYRGWYENEVMTRVPRDRRLEALRESARWFGAL